MSWVSDFFTKSKNQKRLEKQVASLIKSNDDLFNQVKSANSEVNRLLTDCKKLNLANKSLCQVNNSLLVTNKSLSDENEKLKESQVHTNGFISSLNKETEDYLKDME